MKYLRHIFKETGYGISVFLCRICGRLSPGARLVVILSMLLIFTVGNLYFTVSTLYNWGREEGKKAIPGWQRIEGLDMIRPQANDSINNNFLRNNEKGTRENGSD